MSQLELPSARVTWHGFSDAESAVAGFRWAVGTSPGGSQLHGWVEAGWDRSMALQPALAPGLPPTSFVSIVCTNGVGIEANLTIGVVLDSTAPLVPLAALLLPDAGALLPPASADSSSYSSSTPVSLGVDARLVSDAESPLAALRLEVHSISLIRRLSSIC